MCFDNMVICDILIVNCIIEMFKFIYCFGFIVSKKEYLRILYLSNVNGIWWELLFIYIIWENGIYEKIEVEYWVRSVGGECYEFVNVVINVDMMV